MNMGKFAAYILICLTLTCLVPVVASAQDEGRISPLYFGPNALPVPDMLDGRVSERFYVELDYDCHSGFYGDLTQTVFAKAHIPLFSPRVNLSVWMPVVEFTAILRLPSRTAVRRKSATADIRSATCMCRWTFRC